MLRSTRKSVGGHRAFTLIELLFVILLLGVMAAITIPQFANASGGARDSSLSSTVHTIRAQLLMYKLHHGDQLPDLEAASAAGQHFRPLVEKHTFGTPPQTYGPYLLGPPVNPLTEGSRVLNATTFGASGVPDPVPGADFIYDYGGGHGSGTLWGTTDRASGRPFIQ